MNSRQCRSDSPSVTDSSSLRASRISNESREGARDEPTCAESNRKLQARRDIGSNRELELCTWPYLIRHLTSVNSIEEGRGREDEPRGDL